MLTALGPQRTSDRRWLLIGSGPAARTFVAAVATDGYTLPASIVGSNLAGSATRISGISVAGSVDRLPEIARRLRIDRVVIVIDDLGDVLAERAADLASAHGIEVRFVAPTSAAARRTTHLTEVRHHPGLSAAG